MPVTDEKAPKDSDFDMLIQRLWPNLGGAAFIFNCQVCVWGGGQGNGGVRSRGRKWEMTSARACD